ncbi:C6 finger domain-containing protein [Ophiocordyceps camponoti-floridani]|uniref:C6 finger domain-containing protein n=1 Tax=Ophiocordyceps camponoti-floridani TaxID=2030778 RepID=A0A8H4QDA1_9HYPO|nr:C6 finger domain-containing protein [Ophiocordyceps camponoti-floridani]
MSNESAVRRLFPHHLSSAPTALMSSFPFIPHQYQQRETHKNYVFVDEHNRHKRLKVMRACEGCRRRKIKCDAATTNTWPCSACIRLKLHCVRPNGYDGAADSTPTATTYEAILDASASFQNLSMPPPLTSKQADSYGPYSDPDVTSGLQSMPFDHHNLHYTTVPPPVVDHRRRPQPSSYSHHQDAFPTPPLQQSSRLDDSSEACSTDSYQHQDLADLLGTLKVNELGTAPYLRNKASFRLEEQPAVEDDDDFLPPMTAGPGHKVRIPPELMPDEASALQYFDLYFAHVHPYVPVLDKVLFYNQWTSSRENISPLILEALFAIGGRLAEDPAQGQQWLALASRHADAFMDVPRLSTLQALLMILKAREAAPKRGYYYRSWMTVVQCVQIAKDLGLDEHYDDHRAGRPCNSTPDDCQLRTRIWQTIFVCEVMVGTPQGRYDLSVNIDSVDFGVPTHIPGTDGDEYLVSRNFAYFARLVRNIGRMSNAYARIRNKKDWGMDPEFLQLSESISAFQTELPADLTVTFPPDSSPPWLPSSFLGNLHSYYYLTLILFHRPVLSCLDATANESQWKHHMLICYNAARALCRLQEAIVRGYGLNGLQAMQRGFSFTVYAGLSCIVLHLVAIVSPDPELNSDARAYFTRHMRIMEKVMEAWPMPELQKQIDAVREAFSADVRRPFVLKPSFPYASPHPSSHSSPPRGLHGGRQLDTPPGGGGGGGGPGPGPGPASGSQPASQTSHPVSPPVSAGPGDGGKSPLVMMPQDGQTADMTSQSTWNPTRIFEQWHTTFGSPAQTEASVQAGPLGLVPAPDFSVMQAVHGVGTAMTTGDPQQTPTTTTTTTTATTQPFPPVGSMTNFITPAMWQESVASVYEGGLKRCWGYDAMQAIKR